MSQTERKGIRNVIRLTKKGLNAFWCTSPNNTLSPPAAEVAKKSPTSGKREEWAAIRTFEASHDFEEGVGLILVEHLVAGHDGHEVLGRG